MKKYIKPSVELVALGTLNPIVQSTIGGHDQVSEADQLSKKRTTDWDIWEEEDEDY